MMTFTPETQSVKLKIGESANLIMSELAAAGYRWSILDSPPCIEIERVESEDLLELGPDAPIGGPTEIKFEISATELGKGVIHIVNGRAWEAENLEEHRIEIEIVA